MKWSTEELIKMAQEFQKMNKEAQQGQVNWDKETMARFLKLQRMNDEGRFVTHSSAKERA